MTDRARLELQDPPGEWAAQRYAGRLLSWTGPRMLAIVNKGIDGRGFRVCPDCGRAEPEYGPQYTATKLTRKGAPIVHKHPMETSPSSLAGLGPIGGRLGIADNDALVSLAGLENVAAVGDWLIVQDNAALASLSGLSGLRSVTGGLELTDNDALVDLAGLGGLATVSGSVSIGYNAALESLAGLAALTAVGLDITIGEDVFEWDEPCATDEENPALASLAGLNPTTIGGRLRIRCQTGIVDIDAFSATRSIRGDIELARNPALVGLTGLGGPDGDLTMMGDASALRVLACENGPLSEADYLQILINVADEAPLDLQFVDCP